MGDMKTPDFDDLLAAFDIPDATGLDAKEPIQGSHEEAESQLKHTEMCLDDSLLTNQAIPPSDVPAVSVIVKNTSRQELLEEFGDRLHSGPTLQNGFGGQDTSVTSAETTNTSFSKSFVSTLNGRASSELSGKPPIPDEAPLFPQALSDLSPVSSPEHENTQSSREEIVPNEDRLCFPEASVLDTSVCHNPKRMDLSMFDNSSKDSNNYESIQRIKGAESSRSEELSDICGSSEAEKTPGLHSEFPPQLGNQNFTETNCNSGAPPVIVPYPHVKSQTCKLSSCLDALVALNARKDPNEQTDHRESPAVQSDCMKASPKVPISPRSPRSPLEAVKRLRKPPDSPVSICSDSSGKASPAVVSGSPPAIPKVRIKTIKTTSGQIKRTVTSVLPDSENDEVHSAYESSPSQSMISDDSYCNASPHQSQAPDGVVGVPSKGNTANTVSAKVSNRKLEENSQRSGVMRSAPVVRNTKVKRSAAHQVHKPKRVSATTGHATTTNFLPKAMHLASLNLVPHSVAASVAARTTSYQQSQRTLSSTVYSTVPLVHQVKTANSYPRMSNPNPSAGTLNRLLNSANPVPTYVPNLNPPPGTNINLPPHGYCCLECGDSFGVEKSLAFHYSRRSVHIEVGCTHCAKTLVFFNKCALLAHAREHKNGGTVMQCTQLNLKPIAEEKMFVPLSSELVSVGTYSSPLVLPKSEPVLPLYPESVIRHRLRCLECNKQLPDYKALAGHYQKLSEDTEELICKVCSMLLPNKCSFRAHLRIHAHKSPYCCPECGALCRSADIQKHVRENCLHYARKAWYKCLHCDMVFRTLQGQKTHIEEKHCEVLYKCSICPVAFKTSDSCELHLKNKHSTSKTTPELILKCSCEKMFKKKQLLFQHFYQNSSKRVTSVFKCPECNSVFPQKLLLMQHFKGVHVGNTSEETEKKKETKHADLHQESQSIQKQKSHYPVKQTVATREKSEQDGKILNRVKPAGWTCNECLQQFTERDAYVSHLKTTHGKSVKKYPCRHCVLSFNTAISLRRHIRNDHDGKKRTYTCWYCTDKKTIFTSSVMLKNHISLMHGIKNPDLSQMPKMPIQVDKNALDKRLVSATPDVGTQMEVQDPAGSLEAPSAKRLKTQFRCSKCGFVTDNSTEFQQHIPQHKTDENTPQCLHCGLCFTSVLSLNRHLFIVHKIKDPEEEEKKVEGDVKEKEQDNQPAGSAESDEENDLFHQLNKSDPSQAGEQESPHCSTSTDCNLNLSTRSQTQAVSLQQ
ncbi:zinc finger protein 592 [Neolamprologus brichardi]|uniref:zinc finger protein 592 n=1 Tax=Neolamprologus brichardi TaxID=32507 RepID=UPI0003EBD995|nr:zinc finger protein 592 [Neolamprologus brichardi]XP_006789411.1 zinc finger protein 592 [Neolamprologus brichardi]XP_006789412.1 zinc finger protein 592 [Neolamprologus brichardi]